MTFKFIELTDISEGQLIEVINHNIKQASFTRDEIRKLKAASKSKIVQQPIIIDNSLPKEEPDIEEENDFEDEVEFYFSQVKELTIENLDEKLESCLPSKNNRNYKNILLRLKLESIRSIKEIEEIITDLLTEFDTEDMTMFKEEIMFEQRKIAIYDQLLSPKKESTEVVEEETNNRLIFVPTIGGNIRVIDELDHIPEEYYEDFCELFLSIKDGTFKKIKRFTNNIILNGICEVKGYQTRVVFERLDEDSYAVITAFVKKTQKDKAYIDALKSKVSDYRKIEEILKRNLQNQDFLDLHQSYEQELFRKLGYDPTSKTYIKGGK